jgi:hypothetical protein
MTHNILADPAAAARVRTRAATPTGRGLLRVLAALVLFGVAFGCVEAAVVVYLRGLYDPIHERHYPGSPPGHLFPVLRLEQLDEAGPQVRRWLHVELVREAATLLLLAAAALAVGHNGRTWLAAFVVAFGVWDIFYYVFLKVFLDWPGTLFDWDLLFLLPVPWAGPVLAPVLVAFTMIVTGGLVLWRENAGRPVQAAGRHWAGLVAGGLILVAAFCWDWQSTLAGGEPTAFPWPLFAAGEGLGLAAFALAWQNQ